MSSCGAWPTGRAVHEPEVREVRSMRRRNLGHLSSQACSAYSHMHRETHTPTVPKMNVILGFEFYPTISGSFVRQICGVRKLMCVEQVDKFVVR
jgi:hypothetical protein